MGKMKKASTILAAQHNQVCPHLDAKMSVTFYFTPTQKYCIKTGLPFAGKPYFFMSKAKGVISIGIHTGDT